MFSLSHLHPMIVHFPIALLVSGFILELYSLINKKELCLSKAGFYLMILGTAGAVTAYLTGILFTNELSGKAGEVMETHELLALITTIVMVIALALRLYLKAKNVESKKLKLLTFYLYGLGTLLVGLTGFFGGTLVFNYLIGI